MFPRYIINPRYAIQVLGFSTVLAWGMVVPELLAQTSPESVPTTEHGTVGLAPTPDLTASQTPTPQSAEVQSTSGQAVSVPIASDPSSANSAGNPQNNAPALDNSPSNAPANSSTGSALEPTPSASPTPTPENSELQKIKVELAPNPNPLDRPQAPEDVTVKRTRSISLQEARALARQNNKPLQIQALQVDRQRAALRQQQAALYPTLTLNSTLQNSGTDTNVNASRQDLLNGRAGDSTQYSTDLNGNVRADYTILDFSRNANIKAAQELVNQAELQLQQTQNELDRDVAVDYYNLQQADEQVRIYEQSVNAAERSLQDAQALEKAGVGTRFSVLQSEVQLSNERQNLVNAQSNQLQARRQLAQRLSLPQDAEVIASDPVDKAGVWNASLPESITLAYKGRPELERRLVERQINEYKRQAQLAAIKPTLGFFAQYTIDENLSRTTRQQAQLNNSIGKSRTSQDALTNQYQLGLNLRWRFFDGGAAKAGAQQNEVDKQISELQFADDRNTIRQQVEVAYYNLQANLKNIDNAGKGVEQAQEALRLARLRFQAGVGTQIDVINAERDLTQSQGNLATAILGYNRSLAQLQQAVGQSTAPTSP